MEIYTRTTTDDELIDRLEQAIAEIEDRLATPEADFNHEDLPHLHEAREAFQAKLQDLKQN